MKLSENSQRQREILLNQYLMAARGIIHLGAHRGHEASTYDKLDKPVLWVEAMPDVFSELQTHIQQFKSQQALQGLLSNQAGQTYPFNISNNNGGVSSSLFEFGPYGEGDESLWPTLDLKMVSQITLSSTTLDELLTKHEVAPNPYDFWVIDLQGAEKLALEGALQSLKHCMAMYIEVSTVEVYKKAVQWDELQSWLREQGFIALWEPELEHDDILLVRDTHMDKLLSVFSGDEYQEINRRRMDHLLSLNLDLRDKTVLEVGAGIGDLSDFFLSRNCEMLVSDARPECLIRLRNRFKNKPVTVQTLDLNHPNSMERSFDVVFCYGILYHLQTPRAALEYLSTLCNETLLLETCVSHSGKEDVYLVEETAHQSQAFNGQGCRPERTLVWKWLKALFPYVYVPRTQPSHEQFPVDWHGTDSSDNLIRSIFVASRSPIDNPNLLEHLPVQQTRLE